MKLRILFLNIYVGNVQYTDCASSISYCWAYWITCCLSVFLCRFFSFLSFFIYLFPWASEWSCTRWNGVAIPLYKCPMTIKALDWLIDWYPYAGWGGPWKISCTPQGERSNTVLGASSLFSRWQWTCWSSQQRVHVSFKTSLSNKEQVL